MPTNIRRLMRGMTATSGALLATAFLSSAFARADVYNVVPDPADGPSVLTSVGGFAPFDQTVSWTGLFAVNEIANSGSATYYSDVFGLHNVDLDITQGYYGPGIIDDLTWGSGWENVYTDIIGTGPNGANSITDTLMTPFGDFNIPTTFDAVATLPTPISAAALDTDFTSLAAALDADWTTLVADFSALF